MHSLRRLFLAFPLLGSFQGVFATDTNFSGNINVTGSVNAGSINAASGSADIGFIQVGDLEAYQSLFIEGVFRQAYSNDINDYGYTISYVDGVLYNEIPAQINYNASHPYADWTWSFNAASVAEKQMKLSEGTLTLFDVTPTPGSEYPGLVLNSVDGSVRSIIGYRPDELASGAVNFHDLGGGATALSLGAGHTGALYPTFFVRSNGIVSRVGIDVSNPVEKLDVAGNIRLSGDLVKAGGGTVILPTSGTLTLPAAGGTLVTTNGTQTITGATTFGGSTAAQQAVIDVSGKVAIGGAPVPAGTTGKLTVVTSTTQTGRQVIMGDGDGANSMLTVRGDDNGVAHVNFQNLSTSASVGHGFGIWTYFGTNPASSPASVWAGSWNMVKETDWVSPGTSTHNSAMTFATAGAGSVAERMRISSAGNVGIGTTSPSTLLTVQGRSPMLDLVATASTLTLNGSVSPGVRMSANANGGNSSFFTDSTASIYATANTTGSYPFTEAGNLVLQSRASGANRDIVFVTGTSPLVRMVVDRSGNVGIGTTSPAAYSPARKALVISDTANDTSIRLLGSNNTDLELVTNGIAGALVTRSNHPITFNTNNLERMKITESGSIGIGTTTPAAKLDVVGDAKVSGSLTVGGAAVLTTAGGNGGSLTGLNATQMTTGILPAARLPSDAVQLTSTQTLTNKTLSGAKLDGVTVLGSAGTDPAQQVFIDSNGNVGIGTNSPSTRLDVNGAATFRNTVGFTNGVSVHGSILMDFNGIATLEQNGVDGVILGGSAAKLTLEGARVNLSTEEVRLGLTADHEAKLTTSGNAETEQNLHLKPYGTGRVKIDGSSEIAGNLTIKNVGATKSVIRVSPAGDIPMMASPQGINPNPEL